MYKVYITLKGKNMYFYINENMKLKKNKFTANYSLPKRHNVD